MSFLPQYFTLFVAILLFVIFMHNWRRNRDALIPTWPVVRMLPAILQNWSNLHDYVTIGLKHYGGTAEFKGPWFTNTNIIVTSDPMNVHHITSKKFDNYGKGPDYFEIMEYFGDGIFGSENSNQWKQHRTLLLSLLTRKSFRISVQHNILKKVENFLLPFLDQVSKSGTQIDLHDIIERFTFDTNCTILFGIDPNCLPCEFTDKLPEMAYEKASPIIEEVIAYRYVTPLLLSRLLIWLQIGPLKNYNVAKENLDRFLFDCIEHCKCVEKSKSEKVDESPSNNLIRMLMLEGVGEGEMSDKFLRDTALTIFGAGNSTTSAGLSWFFWLVSIHPVVEAKIIQEIKDNGLTQEKLWIHSSEKELSKLVYLHGAICEAMRLYPPVPFNHKFAIESDTLPSGDHISPNTKIIYSLYSMGRMENIWGEDCMEFKPERWISDIGHIINVPSYKFITFNAGPRSCLGKDTSFLQMKMVAISMLLKFHIQVVEGHHVTPSVSLILGMKHGLKVKVIERCIS